VESGNPTHLAECGIPEWWVYSLEVALSVAIILNEVGEPTKFWMAIP
jgi:hypothetical protein